MIFKNFSFLEINLIIIIIMAILGSKFKFYEKFKHYDMLFHFVSGLILTRIGFIFALGIMDLKLCYLYSIAFMFAVTIQSIWEVFEFLCDEFLGTNMQRRYYSINMPDSRIKSAAIRDTMTDTIFYIMGVLSYIIVIITQHYMYH